MSSICEVERVYSIKDLAAFTGGKSKATIYKWIKAGTFPEPVRIADNTVVWKASSLYEWQRLHFAEHTGVAPQESNRLATKQRLVAHAERREEKKPSAKRSRVAA